MPNYVTVFLVALVVAVVLTPLVKKLALRMGVVDQPVERSVHKEPTPHLGGVAIYAAFVVSALVGIGAEAPESRGILVGGTLILLLGLVDDIWRLSPKAKFVGQVIIAMVVVAFGVRIQWVTNPFGGMFMLGSWSIPLTVLWIVAVVNVINLIDGLDGLAAGISSIAAVTLFFVALGKGYSHVVVLTAALAGSTLGFLPYNFNPAKIFMGDSGAMFLGYALAAIAVEGTLKSTTTIALAIPILALGLPILDTSFAIVRRFAARRPIHQADREHLHHRLLDLGLTQRQTVVVMYAVSGWLGVNAILLAEMNTIKGFLLIALVCSVLFLGARKVGILNIRQGRNINR